MNRFNLTFSGQILTGHDPAQVKLRFGEMFAIDDPARLERFFSGQTVILRRNLERKEAAQYYHEMHLLGAVAALVKVSVDEQVESGTGSQARVSTTTAAATPKSATRDRLIASSALSASDQTWAVSSRGTRGKSQDKKSRAGTTTAVHRNPASARRDKIDIAARIKSRKKTSSAKPVASQPARDSTANAQPQRPAAQERAQQAAEQQRRNEEEAARQQAVAALARAKAEEEAARRQAGLEEKQRRDAEEAVRKAALKAAAKRKAEEQAAQRRARREQARAERAREKAEAAARRRAKEEARQRREAEAEAAARQQAEREAQQRREAEIAARRQAELEEQRRREAEEAARRQAELEARQRREAEEAARRQAALEEQQRREAEAARRKAELEEIRRQEAQESARLAAELEEIKRQEAAEAARIRAEAERKLAQAQRQSAERRRALAEKLVAQRAQRREDRRKAGARLVEQAGQVLPHPVPELQPSPGTARTGARTRLEVPLRKTAQTTARPPLQRRRQPGEPNLYTLRPFRNSAEVRNRATRARRLMRRGFVLGALALAGLAAVVGGGWRYQSVPPLTGASAVTIEPGSGPLLLAGDTLLRHDRAGVSTESVALRNLGLASLEAPLVFDGSGVLFARGLLAAGSAQVSPDAPPQLLRCTLSSNSCEPFSTALQDAHVEAFALHALDGSLFLADTAAGELVKANRDGEVVARAPVALPAHPVLRLHAGLLLMNSADGPAISVLRYEDNAFGKQLDEILLLPPPAQAAEQSRVGDFLLSGGAWWVTLYNPGTGSVGLYRFDEQWNYLDQATLPVGSGPVQLVNWGSRTLALDPQRLPIQRFNAQGAVEAPFVSGQLGDLIADRQHRMKLSTVGWGSGLLLCAMAAALGFGYGYLQRLRALVYKPHREHGAEPLDNLADDLQWIDPLQNRAALLHRRGLGYGALVLGVLLLAIAFSVTVWQMAALLLVCCGPAIALLLLSRQPIGYIGVVGDRLALVDHRGMYHLAGGSGVQYRGPFLLIDDVVVFSGSNALPAFSSVQLKKLVTPVALGGVRVDRNTLLVKLLQGRHPLALGGLAIIATVAGAAALLALQAIFQA
ncbi:MAG: MAP7 domain-containing protein [Halioglobus sp.]